jgi:hypothetical protein
MDWPLQMCLKVMQGFENLKTWVDEVLGDLKRNVSIEKKNWMRMDENEQLLLLKFRFSFGQSSKLQVFRDLDQDVVLHLL